MGAALLFPFATDTAKTAAANFPAEHEMATMAMMEGGRGGEVLIDSNMYSNQATLLIPRLFSLPAFTK
jgi:hypothetical protein